MKTGNLKGRRGRCFMNYTESNERVILKEILDDMLDSYLQRDKEIEFTEWLADKLCQEMPDTSQKASKELAGEIIKAVKEYDTTLNELNVAIEEGETKDEWLGQQLEEIYIDMPSDLVGEKLQEMEAMYVSTNSQLMDEKNEEHVDNTEVVEWNKYSIKDKVYKIGKQVTMMGIAAARNALATTKNDLMEMDYENGEHEKNLGEILQEN